MSVGIFRPSRVRTGVQSNVFAGRMKKNLRLNMTGLYLLAKKPKDDRGGSKGRMFKMGVSRAGMSNQFPRILMPNPSL